MTRPVVTLVIPAEQFAQPYSTRRPSELVLRPPQWGGRCYPGSLSEPAMIGRVLFFIDAARGFGVLNSRRSSGHWALPRLASPRCARRAIWSAELVEHVVDQRAKRSHAVTDCASAASDVDDHGGPGDAGEAAGRAASLLLAGRSCGSPPRCPGCGGQQLAGGLGGAVTGAETGTADGDDEVRASDNRGFDGVPDLALALSDVDHRINDEAVLCKQFGDELPLPPWPARTSPISTTSAWREGTASAAARLQRPVRQALVETMKKAIVRLRNGGVQPV